MKVSLNCKNFSYYAFHTQSKELSKKDQKIALAASILMGLTFGMGHLVCGIICAIKSCRSSSKVSHVAEPRIIPSQNQPPAVPPKVAEPQPISIQETPPTPKILPVQKPKVSIDLPLSQFKARIDQCFEMVDSLDEFSFEALSIMIAFGSESGRLLHNEPISKKDLQEKVAAFLKEAKECLRDQPGDDYDMEFQLIGKTVYWSYHPILKTTMAMEKGIKTETGPLLSKDSFVNIKVSRQRF